MPPMILISKESFKCALFIGPENTVWPVAGITLISAMVLFISYCPCNLLISLLIPEWEHFTDVSPNSPVTN